MAGPVDLKPRAVDSEGDRSDAFRLTGAPKETIKRCAATDATEGRNP